MSGAGNSSAKPFWRQRGNISVVMSMSLVLLMMGIVWTLVALAGQTRKSLQEAIGVVAVLKEGTSPVQALSLKSKLNRLSGVALSLIHNLRRPRIERVKSRRTRMTYKNEQIVKKEAAGR